MFRGHDENIYSCHIHYDWNYDDKDWAVMFDDFLLFTISEDEAEHYAEKEYGNPDYQLRALQDMTARAIMRKIDTRSNAWMTKNFLMYLF